MNGRGKNGSSAVANRVWSWAVARWGNLHVDQLFCDRMDELLSEKWPNLKNWGGKQRDWSTIMKHRFSNAREAADGAYKSSSIPSIDMSSPAKRLLEDGLNLRVDDDVRRRCTSEVSTILASAKRAALQVQLQGCLYTRVLVRAQVLGACMLHAVSQSPPPSSLSSVVLLDLPLLDLPLLDLLEQLRRTRLMMRSHLL